MRALEELAGYGVVPLRLARSARAAPRARDARRGAESFRSPLRSSSVSDPARRRDARRHGRERLSLGRAHDRLRVAPAHDRAPPSPLRHVAEAPIDEQRALDVQPPPCCAFSISGQPCEPTEVRTRDRARPSASSVAPRGPGGRTRGRARGRGLRHRRLPISGRRTTARFEQASLRGEKVWKVNRRAFLGARRERFLSMRELLADAAARPAFSTRKSAVRRGACSTVSAASGGSRSRLHDRRRRAVEGELEARTQKSDGIGSRGEQARRARRRAPQARVCFRLHAVRTSGQLRAATRSLAP